MLPLQLAYEEKIGDITYLFTHAGVNKEWLERNSNLIDPKDFTSDDLNYLLKSDEGIAALAEIGYSRGGCYETGSILWGDLLNMLEKKWTNFYQIFGHTQLKEKFILSESKFAKDYPNNELFACLDCRKAFIINEEGVKEWKK